MTDAELARRAYLRLRATQPGAFCAGRLGDPEAAARALGCTVAQVIRAGLCRTPDPARYEGDVREIAAHTGIDEVRLAALLRAN